MSLNATECRATNLLGIPRYIASKGDVKACQRRVSDSADLYLAPVALVHVGMYRVHVLPLLLHSA